MDGSQIPKASKPSSSIAPPKDRKDFGAKARKMTAGSRAKAIRKHAADAGFFTEWINTLAHAGVTGMPNDKSKIAGTAAVFLFVDGMDPKNVKQSAAHPTADPRHGNDVENAGIQRLTAIGAPIIEGTVNRFAWCNQRKNQMLVRRRSAPSPATLQARAYSDDQDAHRVYSNSEHFAARINRQDYGGNAARATEGSARPGLADLSNACRSYMNDNPCCPSRQLPADRSTLN